MSSALADLGQSWVKGIPSPIEVTAVPNIALNCTETAHPQSRDCPVHRGEIAHPALGTPQRLWERQLA